jgi:hypothetical protein
MTFSFGRHASAVHTQLLLLLLMLMLLTFCGAGHNQADAQATHPSDHVLCYASHAGCCFPEENCMLPARLTNRTDQGTRCNSQKKS